MEIKFALRFNIFKRFPNFLERLVIYAVSMEIFIFLILAFTFQHVISVKKKHDSKADIAEHILFLILIFHAVNLYNTSFENT